MNIYESPFFAKVKSYRSFKREIDGFLSKYPDKWKEFKDAFDAVLESISKDIQGFEENQTKQGEISIYKLRKIFEKRYRKHFLHGDYLTWCFSKPFGYAGDFKLIDDIYQNNPSTTGLARLLDDYFMQTVTAKSIRVKKEDFKKIIYEFIKTSHEAPLRIMNLASCPAREIKELLEMDRGFSRSVQFDCVDSSEKALEYAQKLLSGYTDVTFTKRNVIRMALKQDIRSEISQEYDLIYSMGLFDNLDETIATKLIANLKKLLKPDGQLLVSGCLEKNINPAAYLLEWVTEWNMIYRSRDEIKQIFLNGGFGESQINLIPQESGVLQYVIAKKI